MLLIVGDVDSHEAFLCEAGGFSCSFGYDKTGGQVGHTHKKRKQLGVYGCYCCSFSFLFAWGDWPCRLQSFTF